MSEQQAHPSVRPRRVFSSAVEGLSVRAKNTLHAVGVDLCAATRDDVVKGIGRVLGSYVRGCGETTRRELLAHREDLMSPNPVRAYTLYICDDCYALKGEMCNQPDCVFCRRTMDEVGKALDMLLVRPIVDGERLDLHPRSEGAERHG